MRWHGHGGKIQIKQAAETAIGRPAHNCNSVFDMPRNELHRHRADGLGMQHTRKSCNLIDCVRALRMLEHDSDILMLDAKIKDVDHLFDRVQCEQREDDKPHRSANSCRCHG